MLLWNIHSVKGVIKISTTIFGERVKSLRLAKKLTQKQLGEAIGLSMQSINDIEKGRCETRTEKIIELARFFNTTMDYLMGDTDNPDRPDDMPLVERLFAHEGRLPFADRLELLIDKKQVTWEQALDIAERGRLGKKTMMGLDPVVALADFFDVSLDYLVGRSDNSEPR